MRSAIMVGCGKMAEGWLEAISNNRILDDQIRIAGFVDLNPDLAKALARRYGQGAKHGTDLVQMLRDNSPEIVFDIVVPKARKSVVLTAFEHGCDVLSEKPLANDLSEAKELLRAAKTHGRIHAVVQNRRYLHGISRLNKLLDQGQLGAITEIHSDFFIAPHFGGFREEMQHVLLHDMAIHTFDAARYIGRFENSAVYAFESNPKNSWFQHGASASAIFECENNVTYTYRGSWCAEGNSTGWESHWRINCERGSILWDGNAEISAQVIVGETGFIFETEVLEPPNDDEGILLGHAGVIEAFLEAVQTRVPPLTSAEDNFQSLAMTLAAIESATTKSRIKFKSWIGE